MILSTPSQLLRTLAHLRPAQIAAQLRVRATPGWKDASWVARRVPPLPPPIRWRPVTGWLVPDPQGNTAETIRAGRFTFLNSERELGWPPDWRAEGASLLWAYNLHYLEWLWALPPEQRLSAANDWSRRHAPAAGAVGWQPYPLSLRLVTLCLLAAESPGAVETLWPAIWRQAEHLSRRLEYHLLGNHLLENGIALAFVGACFSGPDADRWLRCGLRVLQTELPEQVLADGMHFERSPMYQLRLTHALALLANTGHAEVRSLVATPLGKMTAALMAMCHPDGQIALFNDSAFGVYPDPGKVAAFAATTLPDRAPPSPAEQLAAAGYFLGRGKHGDAVFCDAGPIGPDHVPGHAHGDMFSFELSLGGRRVVVDSGTYDYVPSEMRAYCRSTTAHNTVTINGQDQAEFWAAFRVGRRGHPHDVRMASTADGFELSGWHDGYRHLPGRPVHRRRFRWHDAGMLLIRDEVSASQPVTAVARLHLHPDCRLVETSGRIVRGLCGDVPFSIGVTHGPSPRLAEAWYCPRFGIRHQNQVIEFEVHDANASMSYAIAKGHDLTLSDDGEAVIAEGRPYAG